jgi:hypothetical protein
MAAERGDSLRKTAAMMKPVLAVNIVELLTMTGGNENTVASDLRRGCGVGAFGTDRPTKRGRYLVADGVYMLTRDELCDAGMERAEAAWHVRGFWDEVAKAGSRFEHNRENIFFAAGERLIDGMRWCASGPADQLPAFVASTLMRKCFVVDVPRIIRTMRERADAAAFDLTRGCIFPHLEHPIFANSLAEFRLRRDTFLKNANPFHRPPRGVFDAQGRRAFEAQACRIGMQP